MIAPVRILNQFVASKIMSKTPCTCFCLLLLLLLLMNSMVDGEQLSTASKIVSYKLCRDDSDCYENSFCFGNDGVKRGKCKCKEDYYLMVKNITYYECFKASSFNNPCRQTLQCQITMGVLGVCDEDTALCKCEIDAHIAKNGQCYHTSKIDEICQNDLNCLLKNNSFGFCTDGHCACPIKHHALEDKMTCVPSSYLGEECNSDQNCQHTFAKCYGVCNCMAGYVVSENEKQCLTAAGKFGDPCDEQIQCTEYLWGSYCSEYKVCTCKTGEHGYGNKCYKSARVGDRCTLMEECWTSPEVEKSITCKDGFCTCLIGESNNDYGCVIGGTLSRHHRQFSIYFTIAQATLLFVFGYFEK